MRNVQISGACFPHYWHQFMPEWFYDFTAFLMDGNNNKIILLQQKFIQDIDNYHINTIIFFNIFHKCSWYHIKGVPKHDNFIDLIIKKFEHTFVDYNEKSFIEHTLCFIILCKLSLNLIPITMCAKCKGASYCAIWLIIFCLWSSLF